MHLSDIRRSWRQPRTDRPHRLVGNDRVGGAAGPRHRPRELPSDHVEGLAGLTLGSRFTDADDRSQTCAVGGFGLGFDDGIAFRMIRPALGMSDDDGGCTAIT